MADGAALLVAQSECLCGTVHSDPAARVSGSLCGHGHVVSGLPELRVRRLLQTAAVALEFGEEQAAGWGSADGGEVTAECWTSHLSTTAWRSDQALSTGGVTADVVFGPHAPW